MLRFAKAQAKSVAVIYRWRGAINIKGHEKCRHDWKIVKHLSGDIGPPSTISVC